MLSACVLQNPYLEGLSQPAVVLLDIQDVRVVKLQDFSPCCSWTLYRDHHVLNRLQTHTHNIKTQTLGCEVCVVCSAG